MDFSKLTIGQLKRELTVRNARVSGMKSELVQRLVANFYSSLTDRKEMYNYSAKLNPGHDTDAHRPPLTLVTTLTLYN